MAGPGGVSHPAAGLGPATASQQSKQHVAGAHSRFSRAAESGACWGKTSKAGPKRKCLSPPVKYQGEMHLSRVRGNAEEGA